jgi:hypothetical protein
MAFCWCAALASAQSEDLTGRWRWSCCGGQHSGFWIISTQKPDGAFSGKFSGESPQDVGMIEGRLDGPRLEFTRRGTFEGRPFEQRWSGTLAGDRIDGRLEYGSFTAERLPAELRGRWRWSCCRGAHSGRWEITDQKPDGTFLGAFGGAAADDVGSIEGRVQGNRVEFARRGTVEGQAFEQHWSGVMRGETLRGRLEFGDFIAERIEVPRPVIAEAPGGGICYDPQTLVFMDEWLRDALPPQRPGESLRYEPWGRIVGSGRTGEITVPARPQTRLGRCDWLWYHSTRLRSTNLGTLRDYVDRRRQEP